MCSFYFLSLAVLLLGVLASAVQIAGKKPYTLAPQKCMLISVFLAAFLLLCPIHLEEFGTGAANVLKAVLISLHTTIRLFVLDGDFTIVTAYLQGKTGWLAEAFSFTAAVVYVLIPVFTFEVILSFFRNVSAYRSLVRHFLSDVYVFSELNERSFVLAESIYQTHDRALIVFTDTDQAPEELQNRTKEVHGICFPKEITDIGWKTCCGRRNVSFFTISQHENTNVDQAIRLTERFGQLKNFRMFVFASGVESEMLYNTVPTDGMRIRRVDSIRSVVEHNFYHNGHLLFEHAIDRGNEKLISAVLVGLGRQGTEMLKAMAPMCQMYGYRVEIHAFDADPLAEDKFTGLCPELMDPRFNGSRDPGEAQYQITIHSGVDVNTQTFRQLLKDIGPVSYVHIAMGDDTDNIQCAVRMRMLCLQNGCKPDIQAVIYDSREKDALSHVTNHKKVSYEIDFIGDYRTVYSAENVLDSELMDVALQRHQSYGADENSFWAYEYNLHSSVASAIHVKLRRACGMPGTGKTGEELTPEEEESMERLEHRRWNAYTRADGYIYNPTRNDMGKMHYDLIPFDELTEGEKRKDLMVDGNFVHRKHTEPGHRSMINCFMVNRHKK